MSPTTIEKIVKAAVRQVREKEVKPLLEACEAISNAMIKGDLMWKHKRQAEGDPYHPANVKLGDAFESVKEHQTLTDSPAWLHEIQVEAQK